MTNDPTQSDSGRGAAQGAIQDPETKDPETSENPETTALQDQGGRARGPRARNTPRTHLDSTAQLLARQKLREVRVVDIARSVGSSPATFYQYFKDVEDAVFQLAEEASLEMPAVVELIEGSWDKNGMERARSIVKALIRHWDKHHAVLRVRNLASDEGDRRFMIARSHAMRPMLEALARHIEASKEAGRLRDTLNAQAGAAALGAVLERLAAYHQELELIGVSLDDLIESSAYILYRNVTGRD